jgi:diadenosine tetraphosphate (Ap4A) HIT family hydrolase
MADIHPQLLNDCLVVGRFSLCHLLLMLDANSPWFVLVPDREGVIEIYDLSETDQQQLISESSLLSKSLMDIFHGDKMNIAALGNIVSQCHVHHVVRYKTDAAWPAPIWGKYAATPYNQDEIESIIEKLRQAGLSGFRFADV